MDKDLLDYLKQSFSAIEERFSKIDERFDAVDRRFDGMDQRFERLETEVREVHVVVEDIQGKVQLTAEGIMNVNEKLDRHQEEVSKRFNDLETFVRTSDRALASRVSRLERKVKLKLAM